MYIVLGLRPGIILPTGDQPQIDMFSEFLIFITSKLFYQSTVAQYWAFFIRGGPMAVILIYFNFFGGGLTAISHWAFFPPGGGGKVVLWQ